MNAYLDRMKHFPLDLPIVLCHRSSMINASANRTFGYYFGFYREKPPVG